MGNLLENQMEYRICEAEDLLEVVLPRVTKESSYWAEFRGAQKVFKECKEGLIKLNITGKIDSLSNRMREVVNQAYAIYISQNPGEEGVY